MTYKLLSSLNFVFNIFLAAKCDAHPIAPTNITLDTFFFPAFNFLIILFLFLKKILT